jgi:hypothetical protein
MALKYRSGVQIKKGDHVLHHGTPGQIEFVAHDPGNPETDWYVQEYGGGIMILDAVAGRTFTTADSIDDDEDLEFVSRADMPPKGSK